MKNMMLSLLAFTSISAVANTDLEMANKIRAEGFYNSHVMHTLQYLTDNIGPRLSGSPQMYKANVWTKEQLADWGLENAHLEAFDFGRGWSHDAASIALTSPRNVSLHGIPVAWTPGTNGMITAPAVLFDASSIADLERYKGKLKGKILLMGEGRTIGEPKNTVFKRHSASDLSKIKEFDVMRGPSHRTERAPHRHESTMQRYLFNKELNAFLKEEGALAAVYRSWRQGGLVGIWGKSHKKDNTFPIPAIVIEAEQYNLITRLMDDGDAPKLSLDVKATFYDNDHNAYNTIAEIPGNAENPKIVMLGGHLDSWHASDGAVDNGAGVAVAMEAVRILKALDVKPKNTIRIALWSGEEQGLYGSRAYVEKHFASRPKPEDKVERELPSYLWKTPGWPISQKAAYDDFSVYFNMDNGSGMFRGIYTEGNVAVKPLFSKWFGPYSDLSTGTISNKTTGGTDHESFDDVGLPGFQFIQDPLDYSSRLHHTHIDSFDHVIEADMKQAAVIMAGFVYQAAMADDGVPRKPMPTKPSKLQLQKMAEKSQKERRKRERDANRALETQSLIKD
ncbi:M20/M25/M40 family metallo-hydrolase [Thalassotalea aquiviva]|uniref:M20/M25/M40 family metallo-hydrolase n=1 Tax=Thalassotalea aquiviva TaxID=3242415 RepID=UPI00352A849F